MAQSEKKCAHPACTCMVDTGTKYCSQYCKDAGSTMEIACNCGHAGCAMEEKAPTMTAR
jgi:alpha-L-arabinofuranosidase